MNIQDLIALEEVGRDLDRGEDFYELQSVGIGRYFRDCIISDIESLWLYAGIHPRHYGFYRMLSTKFPFALYYDIRDRDNTAIVVAVLDVRRNPSWIRHTLQERRR